MLLCCWRAVHTTSQQLRRAERQTSGLDSTACRGHKVKGVGCKKEMTSKRANTYHHQRIFHNSTTKSQDRVCDFSAFCCSQGLNDSLRSWTCPPCIPEVDVSVLQELDRRALYLSERISQCQLKPQSPPPWSPSGFARQGLAECWAPTWILNWDVCCDARHGPLGNRSCWKPPRSFERCCMRAPLTQAD